MTDDQELEAAAEVRRERLPDGRGWTHYGAGVGNGKLAELDTGERMVAVSDLLDRLDELEDELREEIIEWAEPRIAAVTEENLHEIIGDKLTELVEELEEVSGE